MTRTGSVKRQPPNKYFSGLVGSAVGVNDGATDGDTVGELEGARVGLWVGGTDGMTVGSRVSQVAGTENRYVVFVAE